MTIADAYRPKIWIGFTAMAVGMFMAILDIQIVASSLPEIQAGLGIPLDRLSWVQTAYLMAEVVAITLSGFLSRAIGTRFMFAGAAAGFTLSSLMCGMCTSMEQMIVWRAIQGFIGGGMVPTVFASAITCSGSRTPHASPSRSISSTRSRLPSPSSRSKCAFSPRACNSSSPRDPPSSVKS